MTVNYIDKWDSMRQINNIMGCEEAFKIRSKARDIDAPENVDGMVDHILVALQNANRA